MSSALPHEGRGGFWTALRKPGLQTRRQATRAYGFGALLHVIGGWFAFDQPWLSS